MLKVVLGAIAVLVTSVAAHAQVRQDFISSPEFSQRVTNIISAGCQQ